MNNTNGLKCIKIFRFCQGRKKLCTLFFNNKSIISDKSCTLYHYVRESSVKQLQRALINTVKHNVTLNSCMWIRAESGGRQILNARGIHPIVSGEL